MKITINRRKGDNPLAKLFAGPPSVESETEYKKLMVMEEILRLMKEQGVNRSELATRMGVNPSRITAMMTGANNFTIETLVRAGRALGAELELRFVPVKDVAPKVGGGPQTVALDDLKVAEESNPYRAKRKTAPE